MTPPTAAGNTAGILDRLRAATSAEDFFRMLDVPYDAKVLDTARLHILKRMGEYLAAEDLEGLPDGVAVARCRATLARAYQDFVAATPLDHRVFRVLRNAAAPPRPAFVPFETLLK